MMRITSTGLLAVLYLLCAPSCSLAAKSVLFQYEETQSLDPELLFAFQSWAEIHDKLYETKAETLKRLQIWKDNDSK